MANNKIALPKASEFLDKHLIWVLGLTPFAIAAVNIIRLSHGDSQVYAYILQNLDLVSLILGVSLPLIPVSAIWLAVTYLIQRHAVAKGDRSPWLYAQIAWTVLALALLSVNITLLLATMGGLIFIGLDRRWTKYENKRAQLRYGADVRLQPLRLPEYRFVALFLFVQFVNSFVSSTYWIPQESIVVKNSKVVSGQVIATDREWTTFLVRSTGVRIVHTSDVLSRDPCYFDTSIWGKAVDALFIDQSSQVRCP